MLFAKSSLQVAQKFAAAIRAFDLPVAEQIRNRQQFFAEYLERFLVVFAPIVAVRKLKAVQIPLRGRKLLLDQSGTRLVGRADPRAAAFARMVKRVLVDFLGNRVVDDVAG